MENIEETIKQAYSKMTRLCSRSEQCSPDIRKKLAAFDMPERTVNGMIELLKEEKYIDDERYVRAYVKDKFRFNKWGRIKIRHYLKMKGLDDKTIQTGLDEIDSEKYKKTLVKLMKEKARTIKGKKKSEFEKMAQIIRFAQNRGFEPELIHRYMNLVLK